MNWMNKSMYLIRLRSLLTSEFQNKKAFYHILGIRIHLFERLEQRMQRRKRQSKQTIITSVVCFFFYNLVEKFPEKNKQRNIKLKLVKSRLKLLFFNWKEKLLKKNTKTYRFGHFSWLNKCLHTDENKKNFKQSSEPLLLLKIQNGYDTLHEDSIVFYTLYFLLNIFGWVWF